MDNVRIDGETVNTEDVAPLSGGELTATLTWVRQRPTNQPVSGLVAKRLVATILAAQPARSAA